VRLTDPQAGKLYISLTWSSAKLEAKNEPLPITPVVKLFRTLCQGGNFLTYASVRTDLDFHITAKLIIAKRLEEGLNAREAI
jgi:hypothetical protein